MSLLPRPARTQRRRVARRGFVVALLGLHVACAPLPPREPRAAAPIATVKPSPSTNWLSKNQRGELILPRIIDIQLTGLDGRQKIEVLGPEGRLHAVSLGPTGVTLDGQRPGAVPGTPIEVFGPFEIEGRRHEGTLRVERRPAGGLLATVRLPLETYIAGVVAAELPIWSAEPAEIEAQAIAARTFAASAIAKRHKDGEPARLTDGVLDQAYRGTYDGRASKGSEAVAAKLRAAVGRTTGLVLVRGDRLEEARYHAACGGHTASFADVFTEEVTRYDARGPAGRPCASCMLRARNEQAAGKPDPRRPLSWVVTLEAADLVKLGEALKLGGPLRRIEAARTDSAGRWLDLRVTSDAPGAALTTVRFDDVRAALGYGKLKSAVVDALVPAAGRSIPDGSALTLQGRGRGHGVGLCQEGAHDHARNGRTADEILLHYYPGTEIRRITAQELP